MKAIVATVSTSMSFRRPTLSDSHPPSGVGISTTMRLRMVARRKAAPQEIPVWERTSMSDHDVMVRGPILARRQPLTPQAPGGTSLPGDHRALRHSLPAREPRLHDDRTGRTLPGSVSYTHLRA